MGAGRIHGASFGASTPEIIEIMQLQGNMAQQRQGNKGFGVIQHGNQGEDDGYESRAQPAATARITVSYKTLLPRIFEATTLKRTL